MKLLSNLIKLLGFIFGLLSKFFQSLPVGLAQSMWVFPAKDICLNCVNFDSTSCEVQQIPDSAEFCGCFNKEKRLS